MLKQQKSTWLTKEAAVDQRKWYVVDLEGKTLGRAATAIATVLRGKHKPTFTPNVDSGDFVVVINAEKLRLTGTKMAKKIYRYHTEYPGGLRETTADKLLAKHPERLVHSAVWGMLPKGRLGRQIMKKLKIYAGPEHNHAAQTPQPLAIN
jgi:large subunit ribosomal protein L13